MIAENAFRYLDREDLERLHALLCEWSANQSELIPPFSLAKHGDIDALIAAPRQGFFGLAAYPTLEEKAAILFYTINKRQMFLNGNKRMSTLALIVFIAISAAFCGILCRRV